LSMYFVQLRIAQSFSYVEGSYAQTQYLSGQVRDVEEMVAGVTAKPGQSLCGFGRSWIIWSNHPMHPSMKEFIVE